MVQTALNTLGSLAVASFAAATKIEQVVTQAYMAMGTTMATYCAQNTGAGKMDRVRKGFRSATIMVSIYAVVTGVLLIFFGKYLTILFVKDNLTQVMGMVDIYLRCVSLLFIPLAIVIVYRSGIQGMGFGLLPMMAGVAELVGRGVVSVISGKMGSYTGACLASPVAWVLAGSLLLAMYFYIMKKYEGQKAK